MSEIPPVPPTASVPTPPPAPAPVYAPAPGYAPTPGYAPGYAPTQGYGASYSPYPTGPRTNVLAIVSLCLSLATLILGVTAIGGVITGHIALSQIKRTGENGRGLALAGVIVGYSLIALGIVAIIAYIAAFALFFGAIATTSEFGSDTYPS